MKDTHKLILGLLLIAGLVALLAITARGTEYDPNTDYMALMEAAAVTGDAEAGQAAEAARNTKISDMGITTPEVTWEDLYLLSKIIYAEAGSDWLSDDWKMSVGEVVLNRVAHPSFPSTIRKVVYQPGQYYGSQSRYFENLRPSARCVGLAKRLLEGERVLNDPAVVYQANFKQGTGVHTALYDQYLGWTYFCRG